MFLRRDRRGDHRFTLWQVGLFFLAAGIWIGGLIAEIPSITGVAILVLAVAMILGMIGRRGSEGE